MNILYGPGSYNFEIRTFKKSVMTEKPGFIDGMHFTEYYPKAIQLKKNKEYESAVDLLLKIIDATEAESKAEKWGVAPGYYEQLANIYRKLKRFEEEKEILIRFSKQMHAPGSLPAKLLQRLGKVNH